MLVDHNGPYFMILLWISKVSGTSISIIHQSTVSMLHGIIYEWLYVLCNLNKYYRKTFNTLRPRQNGHHFTDNIFRCIFVNENFCTLIKFSLKFVPQVSIDNNPVMVLIMAWRRPGSKPLSEPMVVSLMRHICVTQPQWVNTSCTVVCNKLLITQM